MLSLLGSQNILINKSSTSSLPFPNRMFSEGTPFISEIIAFSLAWRGSGYRLTPFSKGFSLASRKVKLSVLPLNSSRAVEYGFRDFIEGLMRFWIVIVLNLLVLWILRFCVLANLRLLPLVLWYFQCFVILILLFFSFRFFRFVKISYVCCLI